jgi:hypothetical protein
MRKLFLLLIIVFLAVSLYFNYYKKPQVHNKVLSKVSLESQPEEHSINQKLRLHQYAGQLRKYARTKNYNSSLCFLVDMKLHSGKNRFFVYDIARDSVLYAGLVAHGSCNTTFLQEAKFSNTPNCGCSSVGKYVVSYKYNGRFGTAFKLGGLDSSNSNAFRRFVVLHGYSCVPDTESYPFPICNSLGCPMVSYNFLEKLQNEIAKSKKPILLWIFN